VEFSQTLVVEAVTDVAEEVVAFGLSTEKALVFVF
jgi:hypothetical protein